MKPLPHRSASASPESRLAFASLGVNAAMVGAGRCMVLGGVLLLVKEPAISEVA